MRFTNTLIVAFSGVWIEEAFSAFSWSGDERGERAQRVPGRNGLLTRFRACCQPIQLCKCYTPFAYD